MRLRTLAFAAALVLADSSAVTLALPEILRSFGTSVGGVSWVLVSFNLALAVAAVPAASLTARAPAGTLAAGLLAFAAAAVACAVAPSLEALVAARALQGVAGAAVLAGALTGLLGEEPSRRAQRRWANAGLFGAAIGPAAGGVLTETLSWEAMFALQAPPALLALAAVSPRRRHMPRVAFERPALAPLAALALVSAALTAALFLLVLLLIEGWGRSPARAAVVVTALPLAALAGAVLALRGPPAVVADGGTALIAGGLAALGLLPAARDIWTLPAQVLVGIGLGTAITGLTSIALADRRAPTGAAAWTIAARHAGLVAGLLLLTPLFSADLREQLTRTELAALARVLDAPFALGPKLELGTELRAATDRAEGRVPEFKPTLAGVDAPREDVRRLGADLEDELERGGTAAFSRSFLAAAGLALLALVPLLLSAGRRRRAAATALVAGVAASGILLAGHLAAGGGHFEPSRIADPCVPRDPPSSVDPLERVALPALDGAACDLGTSREALVLALAEGGSEDTADPARLARALAAGIERARDDVRR
jgi:MFS family permease